MTSYKKALLERGHNFAIRLDAGWVLGEVQDYVDVPCEYTRVDTMAAGAGVHSLGGGDTAAFQAWTNSQNEKIFYEWEGTYILQIFIGIDPPNLRMWRRIPSPIPRGDLSRIKIAALTANTLGGINGKISPYEEPDDITEMLLPPQVNVDIGLYNPDASAVKPNFNIFIRRIQPLWFNPQTIEGQKRIKQIFAGAPVHRWSPGVGPSGLENHIVPTIAPIEKWG